MKIFYIVFLAAAVFGAEISTEYKKSNKQFALELLSHMVDGDSTKNVVFSGYSLETIMGLTCVGAKGDTASELKKVVKLPSSDEEIKTQFKNVQSVLNEATKVVVSSANQIYLAKDFAIEPAFLKTAEGDFKAGVQNIDFGASQKAVEEINSWVEGQTHHKIKNLLKQDQVTGLTRMVLVNALYFRGLWQHPFDADDTEKQDFHLSKDQKIQVDTMKLSTTLQVFKHEESKATLIRIPYYSQNKAFLAVVIPDEIDGVDETLKKLPYILGGQNYTREYMTIYLPKFRVETTLDLKAILKKMGVEKLFSTPDLSGITKENVVVDAINQKVFIDVNEVGTEAAAATAEIANARILIGGKSIKSVYRVDRPFLFGIFYDEILLLAGKVMDPSKQ